MRSAIILVGGQGRRAGGREKFRFIYEGETFLSRLIITLDEVVDEILIVARDTAQCARVAEMTHVRIVPDRHQGVGPAGGLQAGALEARGDLVFGVACDMPCVKAEVVDRLFRLVDGYDAVIPCWGGTTMLEPLHAVYRPRALLSAYEASTSHSLRSLTHHLNVRYVDVDTFRDVDPELRTFTNINRLEDLEEIQACLEDDATV
ncbi:molybdopterin-guanine dinucleotide biosynthesis protein A [Methanomicrobiaceae archaeon CYW5]|nr:molybdopterin-guanine dinucleotide biosynthesis protein A [Methanovulcanius yangii]